MRVSSPGFFGTENVLLKYDSSLTDIENGSNIDGQVIQPGCSAGCSIAIPGNRGDVKHYRYYYRDAGNNIISYGRPKTLIISDE